MNSAWQLLPAQKLERLERWKAKQAVGMVGDGINDAPALAAADLGIAVGTGTQIAQDTADLVLLGDRLEALPEALTLARRTMAKIRQNLFWAFGYNLIALPVAAGVLLPGQSAALPTAGGVADGPQLCDRGAECSEPSPALTMAGRFLVLEGIDGCGKTTQLKQLAQWLPVSGLMPAGATLHLTREPGGTPLGQALRELLLHPPRLRHLPPPLNCCCMRLTALSMWSS